jgi:large subunit ribosomal protein L24
MMIQSAKPRVQRLFRFTAPLHQRQHFMNAHVDKALKAKLGIKTRAIRLATGDTVKIMSGSKRGTTGKVTFVDLRKGRIKVTQS